MNLFMVGVIEDRTSDPLKLGRCKVRVVGLHNDDKNILPTKDLPWAIVMQPVNSAAISGIGTSPTGPVEGTWVIVIFRDEYKQQPIIIGTLAGIPQVPSTKQTAASPTTSESIWKINEPTSTVEATSTNTDTQTEIKKPTISLTVSAAGLIALRAEEGMSSIVKGANKLVPVNAPYGTQIYSYKDTVGKWTIGVGSTFLPDKTPVLESTSMTVGDAMTLFESSVRGTYETGVRNMIKVPVTQGMFDALVSMAYNMGVSGLRKTSVITSLNSSDYATAAALIPSTKNNNGSLLKRRNREKSLFLKDGIPNKDMSGVTDTPTQETQIVDDKTQNPVVTPKITQDKSNIAGSGVTNSGDGGFVDPNNIYPKYFNEPDINRLARNEKIDQTVVFAKESARAKGITSANGVKWDQPEIPYNSKYPFNHVKVTESGHVEEFDDTKDNERIHRYHRSGTYEEIDHNGTKINRIVGDAYEIFERNGNVLIRGTCNVTIAGNSNILVENNSNIDVLGDATMTVGGNMTTGVTGKYAINCGGEFSIDAADVHWNSGKGSGVRMPSGSASGVPEFPELVGFSRFTELDSNYETPEEGDSSDWRAKTDALGTTDSTDRQAAEENAINNPGEQEKIDNATVNAIPESCSAFANQDTFTGSFVITKNFNLSKTKCIPVGINQGLRAAEIVCNMKQLAENCLEPMLMTYPNMIISSGFRSEAKNNSVGGSKTSDHLTGCACDVVLPGFNRKQYYDAVVGLAKTLGAYTQLILETKGTSTIWIHISYAKAKGLRKESFTMRDGHRVSPDMHTIVQP